MSRSVKWRELLKLPLYSPVSVNDIKSAYRERMWEMRPDINLSVNVDSLDAVREAYQGLLDEASGFSNSQPVQHRTNIMYGLREKIYCPLETAYKGGNLKCFVFRSNEDGERSKHEISVPVAPRTTDMTVVKVTGEGDWIGLGARGDVFISILFMHDPYVKVYGDDIHFSISVPWRVALLKEPVYYSFFKGVDPIKIDIPHNHISGEPVWVYGQGWSGNPTSKAVVTINFSIPDITNESDKVIISDILKKYE